jgi:hypothetical protein
MNDGDNDGLLGLRPFVTEHSSPVRVQAKDSPLLPGMRGHFSAHHSFTSSLDNCRIPHKTFRVHERPPLSRNQRTEAAVTRSRLTALLRIRRRDER